MVGGAHVNTRETGMFEPTVQHDVRVQASSGQSIDRRERPAHLEGDAIRPRDDRERSPEIWTDPHRLHRSDARRSMRR